MNNNRQNFYAHTKDGAPWQLLKDHLSNVSALCRENSFYIDREITSKTGLLHDVGKYQKDFQSKLEGKNIFVDHSTAGAKIAFEQNPGNPVNQMAAYVIAGHHAGLPDGGNSVDADNSTLIARLKNKMPDINIYNEEIKDISFPEINILQKDNCKNRYSMLIRMLYSSLVDADFIDTESFIKGKQSRGYTYCFIEMLDKLNRHIHNLSNTSSSIALARSHLSEQVCGRIHDNNNIFYLDMPTGSGKTLASVRFALKRAVKNNKKRIIYVIPYTSIIEQNASVFKAIFGEENVIEHHCNFDREHLDEDSRLKYDLTTENWDAPIIVTTNVQFFESIYANRSSYMRKLHNLEDSIVCFDEVQIMPLKLFSPCMEAISVLSQDFGAEIILMSATMPKFSKFCTSISNTIDLVEDKSLYSVFKRCDIAYLDKKMTREEFVGKIDLSKSNLIVVNTKNEARLLYAMLDTPNKIHLSTFQTPKDRKAIIENIKTKLENNQPLTVVSTSLIEAGVDLDFDFVYRSINGLDSILQCAGRCNREGKKNNCMTYIFETEEIDELKDKDTLLKISITRNILQRHKDIYSEKAIEEYFNNLYFLQSETRDSMKFDNYVKAFNWNKEGKVIPFISIAFAEYAQKFKYIEQNTYDLIIAIDEETRKLIKESDYCMSKELRRKLQKNTISIYQNVLDSLYRLGAVNKTKNDLLYLTDERYYSPDKGIIYQTDEENYYYR